MPFTAVRTDLRDNQNDVEWEIVPEKEKTVEIISKNENSLVLKGLLLDKKVTVIAKAMDGSGVTAEREFIVCFSLKGSFEITVQPDQSIQGKIEVIESEEGRLDKKNSKYILNENSSANLGNDAYSNGFILDNLVKKVSFLNPSGKYYLHALLVNVYGFSQEIVSQMVETKGGSICFNCTGKVQQVTLSPGTYKLKAWGA